MTETKKRGYFITFEGIDGAGKTTQVVRLADTLKAQGIPHRVLREPGATALGENIRRLLLDTTAEAMCSETEMLLFAAARAQMVRQIIKPELAEGNWIICDRFVDSTVAYQGYGRQMDLDLIGQLNRFVIDDCLPDITFWLDLPVESALQRLQNRQGVQDRLDREGIDFMQRTSDGYRILKESESGRIHRIDAQKTEELQAKEIFKIMKEGLQI